MVGAVWMNGIPCDPETQRSLWIGAPRKGFKVGQPGWKNGVSCDVVSGEPERTDRIVIRAPSELRLNPSTQQYGAPEVVAPPLALHATRGGPQGRLGGLRYSKAFKQYIAPILPHDIAEWDRETREWWTTSYGLKRVHDGFRVVVPVRPDDAYEVAMRVICDHEKVFNVADSIGHSDHWVMMKVRLAYWLAYRPASKPLIRRSQDAAPVLSKAS